MIVKVFRKVYLLYLKLFSKGKLYIGKKVNIRKGFSISTFKNAKIRIGNHVFFNNYCSLNCEDEICIGNNCLFGENVKIYDHNHVFNKKGLISQSGYSSKKVIIGNNCWIGSNVVILKGAIIGNNCVIGAGCIINKKIEDNTIVKSANNYKEEKIQYE